MSTLLLTSAKSGDGSIPTEIVVVNRTRDMTQFGLSDTIAGVFMPSIRQNFILMKDGGSINGSHVIQHEYVHFLMRNQSSANYPKWFQEGWAEYLGSAKMENGKFKVGVFPNVRASSFTHSNWLSMKRVLEPESHDFWDDEMLAMFYAQSWAMIHYLQSIPEKKKNLSANMSEYITLRETGLGGVKAFEEAFSVNASDFGLAVQKYVKINRFSYYSLDPDDLLPDFEPNVIEISREQASLSLARMASRTGKDDKAEYWYNIAKEDEELRSRAQVGLGEIHKSKGEYEMALPYFIKAVELAPDDYLAHLGLAEYWHSFAFKDKGRLDLQSLELARKHYLDAWKLEKTVPEIYAMYGKTYIDEGKNVGKGIEMLEQAQRMLASNLPIRTYLAEAYLLVGRNDDAIIAARSIIAWSHSESNISVRAKKIIEIAEKDKQQTDKAVGTNNS